MKIILNGEPVSQARMKHRVINNFAQVYDPKAKEKADIRLKLVAYIHNYYPNFVKLEHPKLSFIFHMPILKTTPKKVIPCYHSGIMRHEKKPDIDNLVKLYLDCLDGILFDGDQKVSLEFCIKLYHAEPKVIIIADETSGELCPVEADLLSSSVQSS